MSSKKSLTIPSVVNGYQVTRIDDRVFENNKMLTKVTIPEGIESIGEYAFYASSVDEVELPSSLKSIEDRVFFACRSLKKFHLPASVTSLGFGFLSNNLLNTLTVDKDNPVFDSRDNCNAVIETATNTLVQVSLTTIIPQTVTAIGTSAYGNMNRLSSVTIPSWITSIGSHAFEVCTNLDTIYCEIEKPFPISEQAFYRVTEKATLYVPVGTKELYQSTEGWKNFINIVEKPMTGIEELRQSSERKNYLYYDLRGRSVKQPSKGIYIHNGRKVLIH